MHSFLIGDADQIFLSAMVGQGGTAQPRVHVPQQGISNAVAFGKACEVVDGLCNLNVPVRNGRIQVACPEMEAEL